ncbi:acetyl-CoA hydrolase/transferase C-terminal domain-containing protein [Flavisphingomonas formosensis]|uniref:acetyl-CoA hydrolase/transferase C-terminal domain-containing protein n=1 Tax=Flavisphingomonas formosensis TaxID=861534 RepID=UPI0012FCD611|nr:acetyl-CoA hydrolase/transferase C-terminal domain-containing protein [Sphingomonas formosensis]
MTDALLAEFTPGKTIYLPGATGEIVALTERLAADPGRMAGVHIVGCPLPGINGFDYAALAPDARQTVFLLPPALRTSFDAGKVRLHPLPYSGIAAWLEHEADLDTAFTHVAPPNAAGRCSFGIAADFSPIAWARARRRVAIVNSAMPAIPGPSIALAEADAVYTLDAPLLTVDGGKPAPDIRAITTRAAALIPDGAAIQIGIGGAPGALWPALAGHSDLRLRSGLVGAAFRPLAEAGVWREAAGHVAGIAAGDESFYRWLADWGGLHLADARTTHNAGTLQLEDRFFAINSALEVDLFGQANLEWQSGRLNSGVGGAPDFARAAMRSPGGLSMILMPATARGGTVSRIVPRIEAPSVSLARTDVDAVVTEHGVAMLRNASLDERAEALIAIAAEPARDSLSRAWHSLRRSM